MESIVMKNNSKQYVYEEHIYRKYKAKRSGRSYYRCWKQQCGGRATLSQQGVVAITQPHDHMPDIDDLLRLRVADALAKRTPAPIKPPQKLRQQAQKRAKKIIAAYNKKATELVNKLLKEDSWAFFHFMVPHNIAEFTFETS